MCRSPHCVNDPSPLKELVTRLERLRPALLPAYVRAEDGHEIEECVAFYRGRVGESIAASAAFREAIEAFARSPQTPDAAARLLAARRGFIQSLPFCHDELDSGGNDPYVPFVLRGYQEPDGTFWSAWCHLEYEELLDELAKLLRTD